MLFSLNLSIINIRHFFLKTTIKDNFDLNQINHILDTAKKVLITESESIKKSTEFLDHQFSAAVEAIYQTKGKLIITGIGKSAHIAEKIVATLNSTGTPSYFLHAAEAVHGDLGLLGADDIVMCISKSGNSPEIKVLLPLLKRDGNQLIGMTSNPKSFLAQQSDFVINAYVESEADPNNLAPTNSTTVQLALGDAIAVCLIKLRQFTADDFAKYHPGGALGKKLLLKISSILDSENKPAVHCNANIQNVIIEISGKRLGVTAVLDEEELAGIITDGDIRRMLQNNNQFMQLKAEDIMTPNPKTIDINCLVSEALDLMENYQITQLLVTDSGKYAGVIHLHDIIKEGLLS